MEVSDKQLVGIALSWFAAGIAVLWGSQVMRKEKHKRHVIGVETKARLAQVRENRKKKGL